MLCGRPTAQPYKRPEVVVEAELEAVVAMGGVVATMVMAGAVAPAVEVRAMGVTAAGATAARSEAHSAPPTSRAGDR